MKKTRVLGTLAILAATTTSFAAVYTYDSSVADWYAQGGFTAAGNVTDVMNVLDKGRPGDANYQNQMYVTGTNAGLNWLYPGNWAGATWQAPTNEIVTKITIHGYYMSESGASGLGVFGGNTSADQTEYFATSPATTLWMGFPYPQNTYDATNPIVIDISAADQVTMLQLRAFWTMEQDRWENQAQDFRDVLHGDVPPASSVGYFTYVEITTAVIPEPASLSLLSAAALLMLRRQK